MATEVKSPTFPESVADGTIANWVKKEGEKVQQDEVIAEIETDKVVLEVVAPFDGVISKIHKPAGEIVQSAELLLSLKKYPIILQITRQSNIQNQHSRLKLLQSQ